MAFVVGAIMFFASVKSVFAVCPVCTVAVIAGLGISRTLGVDDTVSSVWIGGLILSSSFWLTSMLNKREWKLPYKTVVSALLFYSLVLIPLIATGTIGLKGNTYLGLDKILVGTAFGSAAFILGIGLDRLLRRTNEGKAFFQFQKVVFPVLFLAVTSLVFFILTHK